MSDFIYDEFLQPFFAKDKNKDLNLRHFNFFDNDAVNELDWGGLEPEKEKICDRLKAYQRLLNLGLNETEAMTQLGVTAKAEEVVGSSGAPSSAMPTAEQDQESTKPVSSAIAIASLSEAEYVQRSGINEEKARTVHRNAKQAVASGMMLLANAIQASSPHSANTLAANTKEIHAQMGTSLPSYQKLFGSLNYLQCDPCHSIFSPAAYICGLNADC